MDITERILKIVTRQTDKQNVPTDSHLVNDLGMDSLDAVEFVMALEEEFGIDINDDHLDEMKTLDDVITVIKGKL